ncbi:hypothetical protein FRC08_007629 [Ceratobasidium sp. 394]|nr:hypothetical protein FRC08_007629 [Ceratobasidium sp. 394]KAG9099331.1 hypothetical protein FS749_001476 [Ceratobasidium sp. UAMH 11750]
MRARPPSLHIGQDTTLSPDSSSPIRQSRPHTASGPSSRPGSLAPSPRRERAPLRSSPLAGLSYASDGAGGIVQHSSALDEEIARRHGSHLSVESGAERARSASPNSPSVSVKGFPVPSRQNSTSDSCGECAGHEGEKRRARPSFISLAPPGSPSHSAGATQLSPPPPLRSRHSSPNIARAASLDVPSPPLPTTPAANSSNNWMTSTPMPSFSRTGIHSKGVVLPIKADSKSAQRIRRKSMPSAPPLSKPAIMPVPALPESHTAKHDQNQAEITEPRGRDQSIRPKKSTRSLRSVRSLGRMFRHEHQLDDKDAPPLLVPPLPTPSLSRTSSTGSGMSAQIPPTPPDNASLVPSPEPATALEATMDSTSIPVIEETREGKIKKLWAKVIHGVKKVK